jgi:murein DD-endopeptidase MepM/ murein hydrolase activator NlpD
MKRIEFIILALICFLTLFFTLISSSAQPPAIQTTPVTTEDREAVEQAIYQTLHQPGNEQLVTLIYQTEVLDVTLSPDAQWARAWLVPVDSQTDETAPIEPGLAIVRRDKANWTVFLQSDPAWLDVLLASPDSLIPIEEKTMWVEISQLVQKNLPTAPFTGYRLPWRAGETKSLSESVMHDKYYPSKSMHYAFDFYAPGQRGLLWDIYAAKSGTVFLAKDDVPTCTLSHCNDQGSGNYIIIKDTTTTPTSYVLYLHLAQNSIPPAFKVIGASVPRGQFIGVADNTGASYGNHLHFQVQTFPSSEPIWFGRSVDIKFDDVDINGGRPRVQNQWYNDEPYCLHDDVYNDVCDNFQDSYISRNTTCEIPDSTPPSGELLMPDSHGLAITSTLTLSGWGEDDECGLAAGQFIANYTGVWQNIGPAFSTSPFLYELNTCDTPDGTVEIGLRLTDMAVNSTVVGVYSLSKDFTCTVPPEPSCIPGDNQVMLFGGSDYTSICLPFSPGDFSDLGVLEGQASAIMVGANVQATLTLNDDFTGRNETFYANDNNLSDNRIGMDIAGAIRVNWRTQQSNSPVLRSPSNGSVIPLNDIVTLFWENGIATSKSQILLTSNLTPAFTSTWQASTYIHLENLPAGEYTWQVRGQNPAGNGPWSIPFNFTVSETSPTPPPTVAVPFTDTMEITPSNWTASGFWRLVDNSGLSHSGTRSWWYQGIDGDYENNLSNSGDLTSPAFTITTSGHYYLRFYYRYTTETQGSAWDQRWIQISIDNGSFRQSLKPGQRQQLTDDPYADEISVPYLSSQVIDLGNLVPGQSVRLRFHFDTLDAFRNAYQGWAIDDVGISTIPPDVPGDANEPNDTPNQATSINTGDSVNGVIRPGGDFDYFKFTASTGDRMVIDIDAQNLGSLLDPYLFLLDNDGVSVLAENDDEVYAENRDSFIAFFAPHNGTYFIKLRAWNNPRAGGSQYFYTLHFNIDNFDPGMVFDNPADEAGYLNNEDNILTAFANDLQSGISSVDFYFHDSDWVNHNWELLGSDTNGADGWSAPFYRQDQSGVALFVKTTDRSRNITGKGYWNLAVDRTPPQTEMLPLALTQASTAFLLEWSSYDNLSGIDYHELQWSIDNGAWQNYPVTFPGYTQSTWVVGTQGHSYAFRMRAVDIAGNEEGMPATTETSTSIPNNVCMTPDDWEIDNTALNASGIEIAQAQAHNFCNPENANGLYDTDWVTFNVSAGQRYLIQASPTAPNTAAVLSIFTGDGVSLTLRAEMTQTIWGKVAFIDWIATTSEMLYIRVHHTDGRVVGSTVSYQIYATKNYPIFMPLVSRVP